MQCEVCGRKIYGKFHNVMIEGAKLTVCSKCAKHGKIVWEEKRPVKKAPVKATPLMFKSNSKKSPQAIVQSTFELVQDFDAKIRKARRKLGLSHEDLGRKIGEKVSVLKKIETGKMTPDDKLATKLEHALKIRLLVSTSEKKVSRSRVLKPASRELTLGDVIKLDKMKSEEKMQREQS